jgi:hypothetical protein
MPEALDLGYGHAGNSNLPQRAADFVELEWLDDNYHEFHEVARDCGFGASGEIRPVPSRMKM